METAQYWVFNLSPYVFEVKNIPFGWVSTWYGILLLILFYGSGYLLTKSGKIRPSINIILQTILIYSFIIFLMLFGLQKFHINWGLRWYSTMYVIAFLTVYFGLLYWSRKRVLMMTEDDVASFMTYNIIGMLLGARLMYVFVYDWDLYRQELWKIFATWEGGLSFHGGIIGVITAMILYARSRKVPFFHIGDKVVRLIPLGIGMGRIGNFMNGELWGREISGYIPWAVIFPNAGFAARHPSQIYQSLGEGWLLFFTLYLLSLKPHREGTISSFFLIFYSVYRFIVEYFRAADAQINYFHLNHLSWAPLGTYPETSWWQIITMGQILCVVFFLVGCSFYAYARSQILEGTPEWLKRNEDYFKRSKKNK